MQKQSKIYKDINYTNFDTLWNKNEKQFLYAQLSSSFF